MMRVDLHNHTWASGDCLMDPERLLAVAMGVAGERSIALGRPVELRELGIDPP